MSNSQSTSTSNVSASLAAVSAKLAASATPASVSSEQAAKKAAEKKATSAKPVDRKPGTTKAATVERLLQRKAGATIDQIATATGWQAHTCRAFLAGLRKKGREVARESDRQGRSVYRIGATTSERKAG